MGRLFVSYRRADGAEFADRLAKMVERLGLEPAFLDADPDTGLIAGADWEAELFEHLRSAGAVLAVVTTGYSESPWCVGEFWCARLLGKTVVPILVPPRPELPGWMRRLQGVRGDDPELETRLRRALEHVPRFPSGRPPFPGLSSYEAEDEAVFFGREADVARVLELLSSPARDPARCTALLVGESGVGKSSLLKAGVLPRLARDARFLAVGPVSARRPFESLRERLVEALAESGGADEQTTRFLDELGRLADGEDGEGGDDGNGGGDGGDGTAERDEAKRRVAAAGRGLVEAARRWVGAEPTRRGLVVAVDQLEDLRSTGSAGPRFISLLGTAGESSGGTLQVLGTARSTSVDALQGLFPGASAHFREHRLAPIDRERLGDLVRGPAEIAGIPWQHELVDRVRDDTPSRHALPLLAFTLHRLLLHHQVSGGGLTLAAYDAMKGVRGAIDSAVRDALGPVDPEAPRWESLGRALVQFAADDGAGGLTPRAVDPALLGLDNPARQSLVLLVEARLLVQWGRPGAERLEVAHPALFEAWDALATWLDQDREGRRVRAALAAQARRWEETTDSPEDFLWTGGELTWAEKALVGTPPGLIAGADERFLEASRRRDRERALAAEEGRRRDRELALAAEKARRRAQMTAAAAVVVSVVILALGLVALTARGRAEAEAHRAESEAVRARDAARVALVEAERGDPTTALGLLAGLERDASEPADTSSPTAWAVGTEVLNRPAAVAVLDAGATPVLHARLLRDGSVVAVTGDRRVLRWRRGSATAESVATIQGAPVGLAVAPSRSLYAVASDGGELVIGRSDDDPPVVLELGGLGSVTAVAALALQSEGPRTEAFAVSFDFVAVARGGAIEVLKGPDWEPDASFRPSRLGPPDGAEAEEDIEHLAFSGRVPPELAWAQGGSVGTVGVLFEKTTRTVFRSTAPVTALRWARGDRTLVAGHANGSITLALEARPGGRLVEGVGHTAAVTEIDVWGSHVLSTDLGGSALVWSLPFARGVAAQSDCGAPPAIAPSAAVAEGDGPLRAASFAGTGLVVTGGADGVIRAAGTEPGFHPGRFVLGRHQGAVTDLDLLPDAERPRLLSASSDGSLRIFGDELVAPWTWTGTARDAVPAGADRARTRLVRAHTSGHATIHFLDRLDHGASLLFVLDRRERPVAVAMEPEGRLAAIAYRDGRVQRIPTEAGRSSVLLHPAAPAAIDLASGGLLAVGVGDEVRLWEPDAGEEDPPTKRLPSPGVASVRFVAPDRLVTAARGGRLALVDLDGRVLSSVELGEAADEITVSGDGRLVVAVAPSGGIFTWEPETGAVARLPGPVGGKRAVLSPDGRHAVVLGPGLPHLVDLTDGRSLCLPGHGDEIVSADFSRSGDSVLTADRGGLVGVWTVPDGSLRSRLGSDSATLWAGFASADRVVTASTSSAIDVHDLSTRRRFTPSAASSTGLAGVARVGAAGAEVVGVFGDGRIARWDLDGADGGPTPWRVPVEGRPAIAGVADGSLLLASGSRGEIAVHHADLSPRGVLRAPGGRVLRIAADPHGRRAAALLDDGSVQVWDIDREAPIANLDRIDVKAGVVALAPGGERAALADERGVRILSVPEGEEQLRLPPGSRVTALTFSPDGARLALGDEHGGVRIVPLLDAEGGDSYQAHGSRVTALTFRASGDVLASAAGSEVVLRRPGTSGRSARLDHQGETLTGVVFVGSDELLATSTNEGVIRRWWVPADDSVARSRGPCLPPGFLRRSFAMEEDRAQQSWARCTARLGGPDW